MSMTYGMLCDALSLRRKTPGHGVFMKRAAIRLVRRLAEPEAATSIAGRVLASELPPVPPRPDWKPYISEGEVPELPLAPHLQQADDEEPSETAMFFVGETSLVNARRDEESY